MNKSKKILICAVSWVIAGIISILVLLNGALSHSEAKKDRANMIIFAIAAGNVGLNAYVLSRKKKE